MMKISTLPAKKNSHGSDQSSFLKHYYLKCILYLSEVRVFLDIFVHALFSFRDLFDKLKVFFVRIRTHIFLLIYVVSVSFEGGHLCNLYQRSFARCSLSGGKPAFITHTFSQMALKRINKVCK